MSNDLIIRFFGSSDCEMCKLQEIILRKSNIVYDYIDAMSDETQEFCDKYSVDELPHLQLLDGSKVIKEFIGFTDPGIISKSMKEISND